MSSEKLALPPRAQRYVDIAGEMSHLEEMAAQNPQEQHLYQDTIERSRLKLSMLEADAAEAFVAVASHQEPESLAHRRSIIESLRLDEDFGTIITEDDIQNELAALPSFPDYEPAVRNFVQGFFTKIGEFLADTTVETIPLPPVAPPEPDNGEKKETLKPKLTITVFKDHVIQLGEAGPMVSMLRDVEVTKPSEEEVFIAQSRIAALKIITAVDSDGRGILSSEAWDKYIGFTPYEHNWHWHEEVIAPLIELKHDDKPVIEVYKPTPAAKRRYHRNGDFDVEFVEADERSTLDRRDVFEMPNGQWIFGKRAKAMHLLLRSNEEHPFDKQLVDESDIYTEDEKASLVDGVSASSFVSQIKRILGDDSELAFHSIKRDDRSFGYWLEYTGNDPDLYKFLTKDSTAGPETPRENLESEQEYRGSIAECTGIAEWLTSNRDRLIAHQLPLLDDTATLNLQIQAKTLGVEPLEVNAQLRDAIGVIRDIIHDEPAIEELLEKMPTTDPRWGLVDYFLQPFAGGEGQLIDQLIQQFPDLDSELDDQIVRFVDTLRFWSSLNPADQNEQLKNTYDIINRIASDLAEANPNRQIDFKYTLQHLNKRIVEVSQGAGMLSAADCSILERANHLWTNNEGRYKSQRERRRNWASSLRTALNEHKKPRN